ncbi:MAG: YitT family protein [Oscillospiraceae bacterium]|nr:YitT family protein [Oscillospiraceae bacterium]
MRHESIGKKLISYPIIFAACFIYALGFDWCYAPNAIGFGGLTGISQIIHHFIPQASIGIMVLILNIPLFILGFKILGTRVLVKSLFAMLVSSLMVDFLAAVYDFPQMDPILAAIFGGLLIGTGLGIIFSQGASTGGSDLSARLLNKWLAWISLGRLLMAIDLIVIVAVAIAFKSLSSALYGIVALYISTLVSDTILYGPASAKMAYIISDRSDEITQSIVLHMERGVTLLQGKGAYSGADKNVIFCAFKTHQIVALKQLVREIDPGAFVIVCEAREILGDGFADFDHANT